MQLRAIIVDDEFPAREELKCILADTGQVDIVGECEDGEEALLQVKNSTPDVVFLDIQMRSKDGLATAGELIEFTNPPHIVFTTGFSQYAAKAFELGAVDYILKPYAVERVQKAIDKIIKYKMKSIDENVCKQVVTGAANNLCIWAGDRIVVIKPAEVVFAKADEKRQTMLYSEKGIFYTKMTLKELEEILASQRFLRTHKSYLVNLNKVLEVVPWFNNTYVLVLENCTEKNIPVARHYVKEFNAAMGIN